MTALTLLALEGDGIGPEIVAASLAVLDAVNARMALNLQVQTAQIGLAAHAATGSTIPDAVIHAAEKADGVILGPVSHNAYPPVAEGGLNPSGTLRRRLDLYANHRPAATWQGLPAPCGKPFDLVILRENTEGFYADRNMHTGPGEFMPDPDLALALRKVSRAASRRIAKAAFAVAATRKAAHVTAVHKANVLRLSDGLFLEETRAVAARYPDIRYDEQLVDAMAAHLVRDAGRFDVVVTTNMYGDILSDLASELSGGLGLAASLNAGTDHAMAQAQHGSAPDIAGQGLANPSALIGSTGMLLDWLGTRHDRPDLAEAGQRIADALARCIASPEGRTPDLGGPLSTADFAQQVIDCLDL